MYIVTNCTPQGNYTPVVTETLEEAKAWMVECTAGNIRAAYGNGRTDLFTMTDEEVLAWAEENADCNIYDEQTEIYYGDDAFNIMEIFEVEVGMPC